MRYALLFSLLFACTPSRGIATADTGTPPLGDADVHVDVDAFALPGDDTGVDAGTDAYMTPEQDAGSDAGSDAFVAELPDAALDDAFAGADSAPGTVVTTSDSCPNVHAAYASYGCPESGYVCPYITNVYAFQVDECIARMNDVYYTPAIASARTGCEALHLLLNHRVGTSCS
jgi:hypothetical protein